MSSPPSSADVDHALEAMESAGDALIRAGRDLDADAIDAAMGVREAAVEQLCRALTRVPAAERASLALQVRQLDAEADAVLERIRESTLRELEHARRIGSARGYAPGATAPSGLDRSG